MTAKKVPGYLRTDYSPYVKYGYYRMAIPCSNIEFPKPLLDEFENPKEFSVNMLPFYYNWELLKNDNIPSLPENCKRYIDMIKKCSRGCRMTDGVYYLTIDERYVAKGNSHRRPGIHVESYSILKDKSETMVHWGGEGGMFIASNIENSTKVFDCEVDDNVIGPLGSLEHMREFLEYGGSPNILKKNCIYVMFDHIPHESLPLEEPCFRQFFRLVATDLTHWYSKHSTPNPMCEIPSTVTIIDTNKFEE